MLLLHRTKASRQTVFLHNTLKILDLEQQMHPFLLCCQVAPEPSSDYALLPPKQHGGGQQSAGAPSARPTIKEGAPLALCLVALCIFPLLSDSIILSFPHLLLEDPSLGPFRCPPHLFGVLSHSLCWVSSLDLNSFPPWTTYPISRPRLAARSD